MGKVKAYYEDLNMMSNFSDADEDDWFEEMQEDFTTYDPDKDTHLVLDADGNFKVAGKIYNYNDPVWNARPFPYTEPNKDAEVDKEQTESKKEEKYEDHCKHVWVKTELVFKTVEDCKYCGMKKEDVK